MIWNGALHLVIELPQFLQCGSTKALLAVQYVDQTSMAMGVLSLLANVNQYLWHTMASVPIS